MKLPRGIRRAFPESSTEEYLDLSPNAIIHTDSWGRWRRGTVYLTDAAIYADGEVSFGLGSKYIRVALQDITDVGTGRTQSRFGIGGGKPVLIIDSETGTLQVELHFGVLGATQRFLTTLERLNHRRAVSEWFDLADLMILGWELEHAIDNEEHQDAAVETKALVCDADPKIRERVAAVMQRYELAGGDFSDDSTTDRIIEEAGYKAVRARVLRNV